MPGDQNGVRVMLVDNEPERARMVHEALVSQGYQVICQRDSTRGWWRPLPRRSRMWSSSIWSPRTAIPSRTWPCSMSMPRGRWFSLPVASDSNTIQQAVSAGVSAYIVDGLEQHRVKPIVDVAIARFESFQSLRDQLEETRTALEDRKGSGACQGADHAETELLRGGCIPQPAQAGHGSQSAIGAGGTGRHQCSRQRERIFQRSGGFG